MRRIEGQQRPHDVPQSGRRRQVADAPPGHRVGLGEGERGQRAFGHSRQRRDAHVAGIVEQQMLVRFVAHHPQVSLERKRGDRGEMISGQNRAGGIVGSVEVDAAGARPDRHGEPPRESRRIQCAAVHVEVGGNRAQPGPVRQRDQLGDRHPMGREHQDLVLRPEQRLEGDEQRVGTAVGDHDVVGLAAHAVLASQLVPQRAAQRVRSARVRIVGFSGSGGRGERLDDVRGRVEVRLTSLEVEHLLAGPLPGLGGRHDAAQLGCHPQHRTICDQSGHEGILA